MQAHQASELFNLFSTRSGISRRFVALHILACFVLFTFIISTGCSKNTIPPQNLIGTWKTSSDKYADRFIEIKESSLIFGVGGDQTIMNTITDIESEENGPVTLYTFHYLDQDGEKWTLALTYRSEDGGTILLQNRDEVWKKEDLS